MNFNKGLIVQYYMKKFLPKIKIIVCMIICFSTLLSFSIMAFSAKNEKVTSDKSVLEIWQVDSFEGGRGSRADYLTQIGNEFAGESCCVNVTTLSAQAVRLNIKRDCLPDIISYGAGMYGIEKYINDCTVWCRGAYCLLTLSGDFTDVDKKNTVINKGRDNLIGIASLFLGLDGAVEELPTNAYTKLVSGKYKYLLGTQRDIYRLKARQVAFKVKRVSEFNDLYQNISIITTSTKKQLAQNFINYLLSQKGNLTKLGLFYDSDIHYEDELKQLEDKNYKFRLTSPISGEVRDKLINCIENKDINMLKSMLF